MAVETYSVFGAAFIQVGLGSAGAGPMQTLGYTEQGVDMDITESKDEVMTDLLGTKTPQDFQDMGMMARIVTPLVALDNTVLQLVMNRGDRTTFGSLNTPGLVIGINNLQFSVAIVSGPTGPSGTVYAAPWFFPSCVLRSDGARLATKVNPFRLEIVAWPLVAITASSGKNGVLFRRSIP